MSKLFDYKDRSSIIFFPDLCSKFPHPPRLISFFIIFSEVIGTGTVGVVSFPTERKSSKFEENLKKKAVYGHVLGFDRSKNTFLVVSNFHFFSTEDRPIWS